MLVKQLFWKTAAYFCSQDGYSLSEEGLQSGLKVHQGWGLLGLACQARHLHQHCAPVKDPEATGSEERSGRCKVRGQKILEESGGFSEVPGKKRKVTGDT